MKFFFTLGHLLFCAAAFSQNINVNGIVRDARTAGVLAGASILIYQGDQVFGTVSNEEGSFSIRSQTLPDSVSISMLGYRIKIYQRTQLGSQQIVADLDPEMYRLQEVSVYPLIAADIIKKAADKINLLLPTYDFESQAFYREIIRDSVSYYSVAEAIFKIQFLANKKSYRLKLDKGRSKEDVTYSRLFEDFHPGGGPEDAVKQSLIIQRPAFVDPGQLNKFVFQIDSVIQKDGQTIYIVRFDQKPGIHEALESGHVFVNADDFSILRYDAKNSLAGTPYIRSLRGSDKIMADILHIDFTIRGWSREVYFEKIGDRQFLSFAKMDYQIAYQQPKKNLNLNLDIHTEWGVTDFQHAIRHAFEKEEEWKRKNLAVNLPSDFDAGFWGSDNILNPTADVNQIIRSISGSNHDSINVSPVAGWSYFNKPVFITGKKEDTISIIPIAKCTWEDEGNGGMIYKMVTGDFSLETKLTIVKRSNSSQEPDNGFQQGGIILRKAGEKGGNNLMFSLGTGGNSAQKYFLRKTEEGKSRTTVEKIGSLSAWLRVERRNHQVRVFYRTNNPGEWQKLGEYQSDWLNGDLQVGFSVMARFAGDGPRQKPDMKAVFSEIVFLNG